jgi:excisionase family DNA binding protein
MTDRLVLSVAEAAEALGVSDDLVYELTERGELPCVRFGRRKLFPRVAVELVVESAFTDFNPAAVVTSLHRPADVARERRDIEDRVPSDIGTARTARRALRRSGLANPLLAPVAA